MYKAPTLTSHDGNDTQKKNELLKINILKQKYLSVYHLKPKLTSNAVQIRLFWQCMNVQLNI